MGHATFPTLVNQDTVTVVTGVAANLVGREQAWEFVKEWSCPSRVEGERRSFLVTTIPQCPASSEVEYCVYLCATHLAVGCRLSAC
jgi:hypothetical protein